MAKLADAADLKSAGPKGLWGFDSPSRHQLNTIIMRTCEPSAFPLAAFPVCLMFLLCPILCLPVGTMRRKPG